MVSSLLSVHPEGPEIWGASRMLLSVWFADSLAPLLHYPSENPLMWFMLEHMEHNSCAASAAFLKVRFFQAAPTVTSATQHPHPHTPTCAVRTLWSQLGIIARGKHRRDENPFLWSVNNYVAVSESGNRRVRRGFHSANYGCEMWIWRHKCQFVCFRCTSEAQIWHSSFPSTQQRKSIKKEMLPEDAILRVVIHTFKSHSFYKSILIFFFSQMYRGLCQLLRISQTEFPYIPAHIIQGFSNRNHGSTGFRWYGKKQWVMFSLIWA